MRKIIIIWGVASTVVATSCSKSGFCKKGHGETVKETRHVDTFTGVNSEGAFDIVITQDASLEEGQVMIEAPDDLQEYIELDVHNGVLDIENKRCFRGHNEITIYVKSKEINDISLAGSGNISSTGVLETSAMTIQLDGSGNIETDVKCTSLKATITGSGNVETSGSTTSQKLKITGSGNIEHFGLSSETADVSIEGSGNIEVKVSNQLDAEIEGSGTIKYRGHPEINHRISGSGELISDN